LDFNPAPPKLVAVMACLSQLLATHGSILVLDAASQRVQVGLLQAGKPALWQATADEAGRGVFTGTESLLGRSGLGLADIGAFIYCEGPGSMLGTRTVAMTLRTWVTLKLRPTYRYQSLALATRFAWSRQAGRDLTVIADARRETWHCQPIRADGSLAPLQRLPAHNLPTGELLTPEHFRAWAPSPRPVATCSYDLALIFPAVLDGDYFTATDAPDAFQHEAPEYKKWSAQGHSAVTATPR
jgi:tRNA threonylcarbamoyladenosine biosynthesis protein TsaB